MTKGAVTVAIMQGVKQRRYAKNLRNPDETAQYERSSLAWVELEDLTVGRVVVRPGWRWSVDLRPSVGGDWCEVRHVGVVLEGRLLGHAFRDGTSHELGPFAEESLTGRMLTLQSFNASVALCSLVFAAIVSEHRRASEALARSRAGMEEVLRREHKVAETLQRSFLPEHLPDLDGVSLAARYVSGGHDVEVGGDWYDAVALDGRIAIVVGDVEGRGVQAAVAMGQLRNALRTYAFEGLGPADALNRLNRLVDDRGECEFATVVFAEMWLDTGEVRLANAGHPPPLLALPDGTTRYVEEGLAVPIAVAGAAPFVETSLRLEPGSTLLLYTDGLIERRDASLEHGLARLAVEVAAGPADLDPLLDRLLDRLGGGERADDIAMLGLRILTAPARSLRMQLRAEPAVVPELRRRLRRFLERLGLAGDEVDEIVLASCEAAANAIQHPVAPTLPSFELIAVAEGEELVITVRDSGRWRPAEEGHERGRGLDVMASLMELHVECGRRGTEVVMRRRLVRAEPSPHRPR